MSDAQKPGDLILDRYLPRASEAERERAREVLREFFGYLYRCQIARDRRFARSKKQQ